MNVFHPWREIRLHCLIGTVACDYASRSLSSEVIAHYMTYLLFSLADVGQQSYFQVTKCHAVNFLWIAGLIIRKEASVTSRYVIFTVLFLILAYTRIFKKREKPYVGFVLFNAIEITVTRKCVTEESCQDR